MSGPCRSKIRHTELVLLTCRVVIFAGPKVFYLAGEIMVKLLVITLIGKNLNNPANMKYYAIMHGAWGLVIKFQIGSPVSMQQ